jgi:hypothetical protein
MYEVCKLSNETDFIFIKVFSFILFKIVPLDRYTPMEMLFPFLVAALEVFNLFDLQHDSYILLDVS